MTTREKIEAIASVFGAKDGIRTFRKCTGKWKGTVDYAIAFDNGERLFVGNSGGGKKFETMVDECYEKYNPLTVAERKNFALEKLRKRAVQDNEIAEKMRLSPYEVVSVEIGTKGDYIGWYYVTLKVGGSVFTHLESGLCYDIERMMFTGTVRQNYFTAGGLKDIEVDYVFNGVGFSSKSILYKASVGLKKCLYTAVA